MLMARTIDNRQKQKIDTWVGSTSGPHKHVCDADRPTLELHCSITSNDLAQVLELARACDAALCHNIYDVVDPKLGRLLNAERVKALDLPTPKTFRWKEHEAKSCEQFKGTSEEDDLIAFFHLRFFLQPRKQI
jgi:hypothetical protein